MSDSNDPIDRGSANQATLAAGPERAGAIQFQRTQSLMRQDNELTAARMSTDGAS